MGPVDYTRGRENPKDNDSIEECVLIDTEITVHDQNLRFTRMALMPSLPVAPESWPWFRDAKR